MRITILIACLNASAVLGRALDSIEAQDYSDVEVVVADGGSTDGTVELLRSRSQSSSKRLIWQSQKDSGIADAWNKALLRITGDWVLVLGADDTLAGADILSRANLFLERALPQHKVVCGRVAMVRENGNFVGYLDPGWSPTQFRRCRVNWSQQAVFHHRSLFEAFGEFDNSLRYLSDFDFLLRVLKNADPLYVPEFTVCNMQVGGISTSRKNAVPMIKEHIRLFRRHVGGVPVVLSWWMIKAWIITHLYRWGGDNLALPVINFYRKVTGNRPPLSY